MTPAREVFCPCSRRSTSTWRTLAGEERWRAQKARRASADDEDVRRFVSHASSFVCQRLLTFTRAPPLHLSTTVGKFTHIIVKAPKKIRPNPGGDSARCASAVRQTGLRADHCARRGRARSDRPRDGDSILRQQGRSVRPSSIDRARATISGGGRSERAGPTDHRALPRDLGGAPGATSRGWQCCSAPQRRTPLRRARCGRRSSGRSCRSSRRWAIQLPPRDELAWSLSQLLGLAVCVMSSVAAGSRAHTCRNRRFARTDVAALRVGIGWLSGRSVHSAFLLWAATEARAVWTKAFAAVTRKVGLNERILAGDAPIVPGPLPHGRGQGSWSRAPSICGCATEGPRASRFQDKTKKPADSFEATGSFVSAIRSGRRI